jgi:hypothetical protein
MTTTPSDLRILQIHAARLERRAARDEPLPFGLLRGNRRAALRAIGERRFAKRRHFVLAQAQGVVPELLDLFALELRDAFHRPVGCHG